MVELDCFHYRIEETGGAVQETCMHRICSEGHSCLGCQYYISKHDVEELVCVVQKITSVESYLDHIKKQVEGTADER